MLSVRQNDHISKTIKIALARKIDSVNESKIRDAGKRLHQFLLDNDADELTTMGYQPHNCALSVPRFLTHNPAGLSGYAWILDFDSVNEEVTLECPVTHRTGIYSLGIWFKY